MDEQKLNELLLRVSTLEDKLKNHKHTNYDGSSSLSENMSLGPRANFSLGNTYQAWQAPVDRQTGSTTVNRHMLMVGTDYSSGFDETSKNSYLVFEDQPTAYSSSNISSLYSYRPPFFSGTTSITTGNSTVSIPRWGWTTNQLAGAHINFTNTAGTFLATHTISSNTSTVVTLSTPIFSSGTTVTYVIFVPTYLGASTYPWRRLYVGEDIRYGFGASDGSTVIFQKFGTGSPEGVVTAYPGSVYMRTDGSTGTSLYIKETGQGTNTGWTALGTSSSITSSSAVDFGDGSDGTVTLSSSTTLVRNMYYSSVTIATTVVVDLNAFQLLASVSLTNYGTLSAAGRSGLDGTNGANTGAHVNGGAGGTAQTGTYLAKNIAGPDGNYGGEGGFSGAGSGGGAGVNGTASTNSLLSTNGKNSTAGGGGGRSNTDPISFTAGGASATGGTTTQATHGPHTAYESFLMRNFYSDSTPRYTTSGGSASGGGGGGGGGDPTFRGGDGGGAGGAGATGGIAWLAAPTITNMSGGIITAKGGDGGKGGNGGNGQTNSGGGGGGAPGPGANGGVIFLTYVTFTNNGTLIVNGGTAGSVGIGGTGGGGVAADGSTSIASNNGADGLIIQRQVV